MIGAIVAGGLSAMTPPVTNSYESIESFTVGSGGTTSITFGSGGTIPQTYKHLQIRATLKSNSAGVLYMNYTFNGVGGSSYSSHYMYGNGSIAGANAGNGASASSMYLDEFPQSSATNIFGVSILDILDYSNTNKYKTTRHIGGADKNGSGGVAFSSGLFMSTNAITSITFTPQSSAGIAEYSSFALYGIKG
jgi:hypothetical protein